MSSAAARWLNLSWNHWSATERFERYRLMRQGNLKPGRYARLRIRDTGKGSRWRSRTTCSTPTSRRKWWESEPVWDWPWSTESFKSAGQGLTWRAMSAKGRPLWSISLQRQVKRLSQSGSIKPRFLRAGSISSLWMTNRPSQSWGNSISGGSCRVTTRQSAMDAPELFTSSPQTFDLVVTDLTMQHINGDELAVEPLRIRPDIQIILCTVYSKRITEREARDLGIQAFVMKPLTQHELANTVRRVVDEKWL